MTLSRNGLVPDQDRVLFEVRQFLIELGRLQSIDAAYSLYCLATRGTPDSRISDSVYAWNSAFSLPAFMDYLRSKGGLEVVELIRRYLDENDTWTRKVNHAAESDLSEYDRALIAGGYWEDPADPFHPEALINEVIRWRSMRRLWVSIAAAVGNAGVLELKRFALSVLDSGDQWPRLRWPEGDEMEVDF
jgi:hypothetical protein